MLWHGYALILALLFAFRAPATTHLPEERELFFKRLNSLSLEVVDEKSAFFDEPAGDYPFFAKILQFNFWKYQPSGKGLPQVQGCKKEDIHEAFFPSDTPENQTAASISLEPAPRYWYSPLEEKWKTCEAAWRSHHPDALTNSFLMMSMALKTDRYPFGRHVVFHLPGSIKVKGFLAMKTDSRQRPLAILRTGIFSNSQEFYPERAYFYQLFEQSPMNLLILESSSGTEFVRHNQELSLGGFDEGLQNVLIAQLLRSSAEPISKYIGDLHMVGISLGGHSLFPTLWLSHLNPLPDGRELFQSGLGFCPLVNLRSTFDFHRAQGFSMEALNYWASRRLPELQQRFPKIETSTFIQDYLDAINASYKNPLIFRQGIPENLKLPSALLDELEKPRDLFWRLNDFWSILNKTEFQQIPTPLLIFTTSQDPIVPSVLNASKFLEPEGGNALNIKRWNLKLFNFSAGYHCSLQAAYDWQVTAAIWVDYLLKMSPRFSLIDKSVNVEIPPYVQAQILSRPVYPDVEFKALRNDRKVRVRVRFDEVLEPNIWEKYQAPAVDFDFPVSEFDYPFFNEIESVAEARLLERWAQQNVSLKIQDGRLIFSWKTAGTPLFR